MNSKIGLTQDQIMEIIQKVAHNHRRKTFDVHEEEDIYQQVCEIALSVLDKYDLKKIQNSSPEKAFESWLNSLVSNRLANFYRDQYGVKHKPRKNDTEFEKQKRVNLNHPIELNNIDLPDPLNNFSDKEFFDFLLKTLDYTFIEVMFACMSGENVGSYYRYKLQNKIIESRKQWQLANTDD